MGALAVIADWAVGRVADSGLAHLKRILAPGKARAELDELVQASLDATLAQIPSLQNETLAEDFANEVVTPILLASLCNATEPLDGRALADRFVDRFITPIGRGRKLEATLADSFQVDRVKLTEALDEFVKDLRARLYQSQHWQQALRDHTSEQTWLSVQAIAAKLGVPPDTTLLAAQIARDDAGYASGGLLDWPKTIDGQVLERSELHLLQERVHAAPAGCTLVIGESGAGKSALLSQLAHELRAEGTAVVAIKADLLPEDARDMRDLSAAVGLTGDIETELDALLRAGPTVLIIDQLDAVSEIMDQSSRRMQLLLQLANTYRRFDDEGRPPLPLHVVVSSRPFEANHDARFRSLDAETVTLSLPTYSEVEALLCRLGITPDLVPSSLQETLRRPFALKLFVDLVRRGERIADLLPARLLSSWMQSANLGTPQERTAVLAFLEELAADMTRRETLWRPADIYDAKAPRAVHLSEACGLIVRQGERIGFSHQAWLDDFQARGFSTGQDLAELAWQRQDGLFVRATILRGLERLRRVDDPAYIRAVDALLGAAGTRRHLKHLVVEFVAGQTVPSDREAAWVTRVVHSDAALARRALVQIAVNWEAWHFHVAPLLPEIMANPDLKWMAVQVLIAMAKSDRDAALNLVTQYWSAPSDDDFVFQFFWRAALWNDRVAERLECLFARTNAQHFGISIYATDLRKAGQADTAAALIGLHLRHAKLAKPDEYRYHDSEKIAQTAPGAFTRAVWPWFVEHALSGVDPKTSLRRVFPRSHAMPYDWDHSHAQGSVFDALREAMARLAQQAPKDLIEAIEPYRDTAVEQVQAVIAEALAAGGSTTATYARDFLLGDPRRFLVGQAQLQDVEGVSHMVQGWSAQMLLDAMAPHLTDADLQKVEQAIEAWDPYEPEAWEVLDAKERHRRLAWAEEMRFPLLEKLPDGVLTSRRRRQIMEWRQTQPVFKDTGRRSFALWAVGSPMSAEQMERASDDDIMGMLDQVVDGTERRRSRRRWPNYGGSTELSRAFGAFSKAHPVRAMVLMRARFAADRHEQAAGAAVQEMSGAEEISPDDVVDLIRTLSDRGFQSKDWRHHAAWAFEALAKRMKGLRDADLALLESWIETDPDTLFDQIMRGIKFSKANRNRNSTSEAAAQPVLFGYGGISVLPQDNFTVLSAIAAGYLDRREPDCDGWLAVLTGHLEQPEDPAIWSALLSFRGAALYWADRAHTESFFDRLLLRCPVALSEPLIGRELWRYRAMIPSPVQQAMLGFWLASEEPTKRQAAGEYSAACALLDPDDGPMVHRLSNHLRFGPAEAGLGALFGTALVWRDNTGPARRCAHDILMQYRTEEAPISHAIAAALDLRHNVTTDPCLRELLGVAADNRAVLMACLNSGFVDELQELLLHPGFEEVILRLAEAAADLMLERRTGGLVEDNLVAIAIALQRSEPALRKRAMDLYERLLDVNFYGADEAAKALLRR